MMEFEARILIDTQDPELAYDQLRAALQFTGLHIKIRDTWMRNNEQLPANAAQQIALKWQRSKHPVNIDRRVQFQTNDPAVMTELNQMDLFGATPNDVRNLAYMRAEGEVYLIEVGEENVDA